MITKIIILNADYSGIEGYFPKGREFNTNSRIVLVIGPNGVGKTAFLRMLATTLDDIRLANKQNLQPPRKYVDVVSSKWPVYTLDLPLSKGSSEGPLGLELYLREWYYEFDPSYDGSEQISTLDYFFGDVNLCRETGFDPTEVRITESSSGQTRLYELKNIFLEIEKFFGENLIIPPQREKTDDQEDIKRLEERVPNNACLTVFMDEPTAHLDYLNIIGFTEQLNRTSKKYEDRLQFFVHTHCPALIEKTEGCIYINMYKKPAVSVRTFGLLNK